MEEAKTLAEQGAEIISAGDLTIYRVAELREIFLRRMEQTDDLTIDLKEMAQCDIAGIQLLLSLKMSAMGAGKKIAIINPPDLFLEAIERAGLDSEKMSIHQHLE